MNLELPCKSEAPWPSVQIRHCARFTYGDSLAAEDRADGSVPVFGSNGQVGVHNAANTRGPVIVIGRKGSYGKVRYSEAPVFAIDTTYSIDASTTRHELRWLYYALLTAGLDTLGQDVGVPGLNRENAYAQRIPLPPLAEQRAIADYLDAETTRIDALIAKKQQLIRLLEERGREFERSMTLGRPEVAVPLRWSLRVGSGEGLPADEILPPGVGVTPVIGGNGVSGSTMRGTLVAEPSLAVGRVGALCGNVHSVDEPAWITDNALWLRRIDGYERAYLEAAIRSADLNSQADRTAQPLITGEKVKAVAVPRPSRDEQRVIVEELNTAAVRSGRLAVALGRQVELISERRQALITAAVTGEFAVRGRV